MRKLFLLLLVLACWSINAETHYEALGVTNQATRDEIRAAYRSLAKANHPDVKPGDQAAEARMKAANDAYAVLYDPASRAAYDATLRPSFPWNSGNQSSGRMVQGINVGDRVGFFQYNSTTWIQGEVVAGHADPNWIEIRPDQNWFSTILVPIQMIGVEVSRLDWLSTGSQVFLQGEWVVVQRIFHNGWVRIQTSRGEGILRIEHLRQGADSYSQWGSQCSRNFR